MLIIVEMKVLFLTYLRDLSETCDNIIRISCQIHSKLFPSTVLAHDIYDLWFSQLAKHITPGEITWHSPASVFPLLNYSSSVGGRHLLGSSKETPLVWSPLVSPWGLLHISEFSNEMYLFIRVMLQGMITYLFFEAVVGICHLLLIFMVSCTILSKIYNNVWINCMMKKREAIQD